MEAIVIVTKSWLGFGKIVTPFLLILSLIPTDLTVRLAVADVSKHDPLLSRHLKA